MSNKHIILIGFKNVGKSTVGKILANKLKLNFIDLDNVIENIYYQKMSVKLTCREIMLSHGEEYFRSYESESLMLSMQNEKSIISLGGGTCENAFNLDLLEGNTIIHITADLKITYDRLMSHGVPAFFPATKHPEVYFNEVWHKRNRNYKKIATLTVDNSFTVEQTIETILKDLRHD